jgi:hypothetical protein
MTRLDLDSIEESINSGEDSALVYLADHLEDLGYWSTTREWYWVKSSFWLTEANRKRPHTMPDDMWDRLPASESYEHKGVWYYSDRFTAFVALVGKLPKEVFG